MTVKGKSADVDAMRDAGRFWLVPSLVVESGGCHWVELTVESTQVGAATRPGGRSSERSGQRWWDEGGRAGLVYCLHSWKQGSEKQ